MANQKDGCLYVDHLYIHPDYQSNGIGTQIVLMLKQDSKLNQLVLRLGALRDSRANAFYNKQGFKKTHEEQYDIYYEWLR